MVIENDLASQCETIYYADSETKNAGQMTKNIISETHTPLTGRTRRTSDSIKSE